MWRVLVVAVLVACLGCGGVTLRSNLQSNSSVLSLTGFVSSIQTGNLVVSGGFVEVTNVTIIVNGAASTVTFCGALTNQFPLNSFVNMSFTPGLNCASLVFVAIEVQN